MLLHAQIEANKRNTLLLAALFLVFFALVGAAAGIVAFDSPVGGLILAVVVGLIYITLTTASGPRIIMAMNHAREIESEDDNPFLWNTVESLAIGARLPMPKVFIIDDPSPNAFAAGMSPQKAAVAVTTGLLERLDRQEIEAVLAHEIAHVRNYDVRLATTVIALVAAIAVVSEVAHRTMFVYRSPRQRNRRESKGSPYIYAIALIFLLLSPLIGTLIRLSISRNREYLADASGAELCRNPNALASALRKISAVDEPVQAASETCAALYISDPFKKPKRNWFATHPPVEERIRRLERMM